MSIFPTYHSVWRGVLFKIVATILAPWLGGLDHIGRIIALSWLRIRWAVSASVVTVQRFPHRSSEKPTQQQSWQFSLQTLVFFSTDVLAISDMQTAKNVHSKTKLIGYRKQRSYQPVTVFSHIALETCHWRRVSFQVARAIFRFLYFSFNNPLV